MVDFLLYEFRKERNLTLLEVSKMTGISKTMLNYYENEKTSPRLDVLEEIAKGLNCKMTDLFDSEYK